VSDSLLYFQTAFTWAFSHSVTAGLCSIVCHLLSIAQVGATVMLLIQGFKPRRSLEVLMFTSEEPTRFGLSCIGSRAMAGALEASVLDARLDENGTTFEQVLYTNCCGQTWLPSAEILILFARSLHHGYPRSQWLHPSQMLQKELSHNANQFSCTRS
jgi:hypothetical protein